MLFRSWVQRRFRQRPSGSGSSGQSGSSGTQSLVQTAPHSSFVSSGIVLCASTVKEVILVQSAIEGPRLVLVVAR